jgi:hypothetical protein
MVVTRKTDCADAVLVKAVAAVKAAMLNNDLKFL